MSKRGRFGNVKFPDNKRTLRLCYLMGVFDVTNNKIGTKQTSYMLRIHGSLRMGSTIRQSWLPRTYDE